MKPTPAFDFSDYFRPWYKRLSTWHNIALALFMIIIVQIFAIWAAVIRVNGLAESERFDFDWALSCSEKLNECEARCPIDSPSPAPNLP